MATGQRPDNFFLQRFEDSRRCLCADTNVGVDEIGRASPLHRRGLVPTDKGRVAALSRSSSTATARL